MRATLVVIVAALCLLAHLPIARAGNCGQLSDVLILVDRSGSMNETVGGQTKWSIAVTAVNTLLNTFAGQINFGVMPFSRHPFVSNCSSGKVNVAPAAKTASAITQLLTGITPQGDTPLSLSLDEARVYLQGNPTGNPQYVLLVTDGKETCQAATVNTPQGAAGKLFGVGVKTYVVGFGAAVDPVSLGATAQAGGTSTYYQSDDLTQLNSALTKIAGAISCCGDGKLDAGETCDIAIPAGKPGACPTSCNDNNVCTVDSLIDKGCNTTCFYSAVTTPKNGDGCCPPGASSATDSDCPASCGNGVVDAGETCDTGIPSGQSGGCPTSCDDGNTCTQDSLKGSGCDATCENANVCPTNLCGNGKVELGEWCDTAIAAGQPGACPKSCDDSNPCTQDTMLGAACLAKCSNVPITQPVSGDGCCPVGATAAQDSDCSATCGNGVVEAGETCDPQILWGPGACKKLSDCDDANACTKDFVIGSACNVACGHSPVVANLAVKDGCCPAGMTSKQDADCKPACDPDSHENCTDPCAGVKCKTDEVCHIGKCLPKPAPATPEGEGIAPTGLDGCHCRVGAVVDGVSASAALLFIVGLALLSRRRRWRRR